MRLQILLSLSILAMAFPVAKASTPNEAVAVEAQARYERVLSMVNTSLGSDRQAAFNRESLMATLVEVVGENEAAAVMRVHAAYKRKNAWASDYDAFYFALGNRFSPNRDAFRL